MNEIRDRRAHPHEIYPYDAVYESSLLRGWEDPRPWRVQDVIAGYLEPHHTLVDIGCGTAYKTLDQARKAQRIVGVEPSSSMRAKAVRNIADAGIDNFAIVGGKSQALPLADGSVDLLSSVMSPPDAKEFSRVVRDGGIAVVENLGERDKYNVTVEFGRDDHGLRGMFIECAEGERLEYFTEQFADCFSNVEVIEGRWGTRYSYEGLLLLLEQTPTVRGFDREKDHDALQRVMELYGSPDGVETFQHRVLVVARK